LDIVGGTESEGTLHWGDTASFADPVTDDTIHYTLGAPTVDPEAHTKKGRKLVIFNLLVVNSAPAGSPEFSLGAFELHDIEGNRYNAIDMARGGLGLSVVAGGRFNEPIGWEIPETHTPASVTVSLMGEGMREFTFTWHA
jgi:hypothetical protein